MDELTGTVAVVVGAGRGLGLAASQALAREGAAVVLAARTAAEVEAAAAAIAGAGGEARAEAGDASREADAERIVAAAVAWKGRVDLLLVCAGAPLIKPLTAVTLDEWEHLFAVNVRAVFLTNRAALRVMAPAGRGTIVNLASRAGITGAPNIAGYAAAKAAVMGFSRALALEAKPHGVRVACLAPGPMDTPMRWAATPDVDPARLIAPAAVVDQVLYLMRHPTVVLEDPVVPAALRL